MKRVVIVAPHFPPSNLAGVHRARLFANHLAEFGWRPTVLSVAEKDYEESLDPELSHLVTPDLEVIRVRALPIGPVRVVGDLGLRAYLGLARGLEELVERARPELVYIPVAPNYPALLGNRILGKLGVPFAVDIMDPWAHPFPGCDRPFTRAWASYRLARYLEPRALRRACLITAVAPGYWEGACRREPALERIPKLALPMGMEPRDFEYLEAHPREAFLFSDGGDVINLVYAGAILPRAISTWKALFKGLALARRSDPRTAMRIRIHLLGTGSTPSGGESLVEELARAAGVEEAVHEQRARLPYLDVLNHLSRSGGVLVVGSTEAHYTASKTFQALQSGRPVMGLLHRSSSAAEILARAASGPLVLFDEVRDAGFHEEEISDGLLRVARGACPAHAEERERALAPFSARELTRRLARAFDESADGARP